jgi:hypothetical protein
MKQLVRHLDQQERAGIEKEILVKQEIDEYCKHSSDAAQPVAGKTD